MGLTYLDSSVVIHAAAKTEDGARVREILNDGSGNEFVISPLVRMESLVRPIRANDTRRIREREGVLELFGKTEINAETFELATHVRARHGFSTADAIHVATASLKGCDAIWTTDKQLARKLPNFAVNILEVS